MYKTMPVDTGPSDIQSKSLMVFAELQCLFMLMQWVNKPNNTSHPAQTMSTPTVCVSTTWKQGTATAAILACTQHSYHALHR